eukprot:3135127-Prymnesium_polylepis.1
MGCWNRRGHVVESWPWNVNRCESRWQSLYQTFVACFWPGGHVVAKRTLRTIHCSRPPAGGRLAASDTVIEAKDPAADCGSDASAGVSTS